MTLWLFLALMTVVAIATVIWPLLRHGVATRSGSDVVVYRDQLDEVERDRAAGLIGKTEAQAARVEISRRLLAAAEAAKRAPQADSAPAAWRRWAIAAISLLLLPAGATALYLRLGQPGLASEPLAERMEAATPNKEQSIEKLVVQVEQHLQTNPNDGHGWEVLAPVYMQVGRYTDSVNAWRNAIRLLGDNADREADLGESLMAEASGVVTKDAKAAFVRAVTLDNTTVTARYYLGVAAQQDGKRDEAAKIWRDLIADATPGAQWVSTVRAALARLEGKTAPSTALPGPTPAEMLAAAEQPPAQRDASIKGMVERLAEKLKKDGSDPSAWAQLVRSYKVMGEPDKLKTAVVEARRALASDPAKAKQFDAELKDIENGESPPPAAAAAPLPGPTPAQMLAAAEQPPMQQNGMISGMVERLAERLKTDGSDVKGWLRLVHSYKVMGDAAKQKAAVADARKALASDPAKLKEFETELVKVESGDNPTSAAVSAPPTGAAAPQPGATTAHQNSSINDMVERLAERLKKDGSDVNGWVQLVRSYRVMGDTTKEKAAVADAHSAFAKDPAKLKQLDAALKADASGAAPAAANPAQKGAPGATTEHQVETIDVMVQHLSDRLKKSGDNAEGWLMLTRTYLTLKQNDKAMATVKDARKALAADPQKLEMFEAALKHFKIEAPK